MMTVDTSADDPFAVLGLSPRTPIQTIDVHVQTLVERCDSDSLIDAAITAYEEIEAGPHVREVRGTTIEPLLLDVDESTAEVGGRVYFMVTDIAGEPVENVTISINGTTVDHTDRHGTGMAVVNESGALEITAKKAHPTDGFEYLPQTVSVSVTQRHRQLTFESCPKTAAVGEPLPVTITDDTGNAVRGVTVRGPQAVSEPTDCDGHTTLIPVTTGTPVELVASKNASSNQRYYDATTTIRIEQEN